MRKLLGIFIFISSILSFSSAQSDVLERAEQMPYFAGCEEYSTDSDEKRDCSNQSLVNFITNNLEYPSSAKANGIEGTVVVSFVVDEEGDIILPEIVYDIGGGCGDAALEILQRMPTWQAGVHEEKRVKIKLTLPINFVLAEEDPDPAQEYNLAWGKLMKNTATRKELQENLEKRIYVRDKLGDNVAIDELVFAYEKKDKLVTVRCRGNINEEVEKMVSKIKKGGIFNITASVQDKGSFFYVNRSFEVVEEN